MAAEMRLIVTYISILVLDMKYNDAIRAIDIVQASNIRDRLLKANLKKIHAISLMKSDTPRVNEAYKKFKEAAKAFDTEGDRMQTNNEANLGVALCSFGMGCLMYHKVLYFISKD